MIIITDLRNHYHGQLYNMIFMRSLFLVLTLAFTYIVPAASAPFPPQVILAPQPSTCIQSSFSSSGSSSWQTISLTLKNGCGQAVSFQNAIITFVTKNKIDTNFSSFWGNFNPLSYPINTLKIVSRLQPNGSYLASLPLQFPSESWAISVLPANQSITIMYGAPVADYLADSVNVYLAIAIGTGTISLTNTTPKPPNVSQPYAVVYLATKGQPFTSVQLPWQSTQKISGLAAGNYIISPSDLTDSQGNNYKGTAQPMSLTLSSAGQVASTISYTKVPQVGSIIFNINPIPSQISTYTGLPTITLFQPNTGSSLTKQIPWNTEATVSQLVANSTYTFIAPNITYNGYNCAASFNPTSAIAVGNTPSTPITVTYTCALVPQDIITINVGGLPTSITSIDVKFVPNDNSIALTNTVSLQNGQGSATISLIDGTIYTVSSTTINDYAIAYNPQPLTAKPQGIETINYSKNTGGGRVIGYLAGWRTPPSVTALVNAGYTHVLVAFGVFSTSNPGQITPAFDTISPTYIKALQNAGIKVLLSLGGASTSLHNTTVDFNQVINLAASSTAFTQTFIQSLTNLITQYGFDGFDFDIETGLLASGNFTNPQGNIAILANIINNLHTTNPGLLLTLAPQATNIAATQGFSEPWGNYASLIMQTYASLSWVGIQLYYSGCMFGIDMVCYDPNKITSPDFSVAMATDLLTSWPAKTNLGQSTGFQPYISYLHPSQIVLGYAAANSGSSPVYPIAIIKRAIQCLRSARAGADSCDTYIPPAAYPNIGGAFVWNINFDAANQYPFATGLKNCLTNGNCS